MTRGQELGQAPTVRSHAGVRPRRLAMLAAAIALGGAMPATAQDRSVAAVPPIVGAIVAPSGSGAVPVVPPTVTAAEYRISAGDELDISVWGEERMQRTVRVLSDGTFAFPLAGTIPATGQTVRQVSHAIRERIASYYRADIPDVTVGVRTAAAMTFYVIGKVRTPGTYASTRTVNIVQALSMAGGLAEFANVKRAVILRQTATGQTVEPVQLARILKGQRRLTAGALDQALPVLGSGDVLIIP